MEAGEVRQSDTGSAPVSCHEASVEDHSKLTPRSSRSLGSTRVNESAKRLKLDKKLRHSRMLHKTCPHSTSLGAGSHLGQRDSGQVQLREDSTSASMDRRLGPEDSLHGAGPSGQTGISTRDSALLQSMHDASKLMSVMAQPPSEAGGRSQLNTHASYFDLEGQLNTHASLAVEGPLNTHASLPDGEPGLRASRTSPNIVPGHYSARHCQPGGANHGSAVEGRKRPMDDSALEAEYVADAAALEKLWPLMAAVQRRQTNSSYSPRKASAPSFRLTSTHDHRSPELTRAQVEFLGTSRTASMNGPKSGVSKNSGFFNRHNSFPSSLKPVRRDCYDSLRLLDPRKERRMDPQERVRVWLEQGEQYFLSSAAPDWEKNNELPPRAARKAAKVELLEPHKLPKVKPLERLFSCFAL